MLVKRRCGEESKTKNSFHLEKNASNFNTNMSYSPFVVIVFPTSDGQIHECFIKWRSNEPLLKSEVIEQIMEEIKTIKLSYENIPKGKVYYCPNIGFGITKKDWVYITSRSNQ